MKKLIKKRRWLIFLCCLALCLGSATSAYASSNVKPGKTSVSLTSKKPGWKQIGKYWYYYSKSGRLQGGWIQDKGKVYYSNSSGRMLTGLQTINGSKYYFTKTAGSKQGARLQNKWQKVGNDWYYFQGNGKAKRSSWMSEKGQWYYFDSNCKMVTGWKKIGGKWYYMYPDKGNMAANTWIGGKWVGADGAMVSKSWSNDSKTKMRYSSPTLNIAIKKKNNGYTNYWVARVKTSSSSQLKSALSFGTYGGARQTTSSAVRSNGGIIGINGSAFDYATGKPSPLGMCIKNGKIYGNYMTSYTVMAVKKDGTIFTPPQGLMGNSLLNMGVKDTYNFGPILINNGVTQPPIAETNKYYPRVAVGMVQKNDYILLCADGKGVKGSRGLNHWEMVNEFRSFGCSYAYNLDGGGSATLYYNGKVLNNPSDGRERPCADFLFFTK